MVLSSKAHKLTGVPDAQETAKFIEMCISFFDCLNVDNLCKGDFKKPYIWEERWFRIDVKYCIFKVAWYMHLYFWDSGYVMSLWVIWMIGRICWEESRLFSTTKAAKPVKWSYTRRKVCNSFFFFVYYLYEQFLFICGTGSFNLESAWGKVFLVILEKLFGWTWW